MLLMNIETILRNDNRETCTSNFFTTRFVKSSTRTHLASFFLLTLAQIMQNSRQSTVYVHRWISQKRVYVAKFIKKTHKFLLLCELNNKKIFYNPSKCKFSFTTERKRVIGKMERSLHFVSKKAKQTAGRMMNDEC